MIGNGIKHKCSSCGYEVDYDYESGVGYVRTVGDKDFVKITSGLAEPEFETDILQCGYYGGYAAHYRRVILLGCPKCKTVSYKE